jgi:hypothetical protein
MKLKRRNFFSLIAASALAIFGSTWLSMAQKKYLTLTRKRSLPFFTGWYEFIENAAGPAQVAGKGINLVIPYIEGSKLEKIQVFLDAAKAARIKVLLEVYRPLVESGNLAGTKEFIRTYKNHPAVYGWYLYDEPEIKKPTPLTPELLTAVYQAIKEEDKSKPVAIVFSDVNKIASYSNAMDITMWDAYPCNDNVPEFQWVSSYRESLNRVINIAEAKQKKFWNVLQAYSGHGLKKRPPTKAEFRYMFYYSIFSGSDGLLFWMHPWSTPAWNESVLYPTINEFRPYTLAIINGYKSLNITPLNYKNSVEIRLLTIPKSRKKLMVAINHDRAPVTMTVKLDRALAGKSVAIDKRRIDRVSVQSNLQVALLSYEVRLYEIG